MVSRCSYCGMSEADDRFSHTDAEAAAKAEVSHYRLRARLSHAASTATTPRRIARTALAAVAATSVSSAVLWIWSSRSIT